MGCCSLTPRSAGIDDVGPEELELLEIGSAGVWSLGESKQKVTTRNKTKEPPERCPSDRQPKQEVPHLASSTYSTQKRNSQVVLWERTRDELHQSLYTHPIREWEGQALHSFGDIIYSSLLSLYNGSTKVISERYVVLFSFHLLILALDNLNQKFIYEGILPLSAIHVQVNSQKDSTAPPMFEISGTMVDSKIFICNSAVERKCWLEKIEDRIEKSQRQQLSLSHSALSYLLPCDERWKKEELKRDPKSVCFCSSLWTS
ncbi:rho guanine nucleotide exchange factor 7 isoform X2 [Electrophorus electricus]|uniref:rho guanine nucleotide exchange factor 7 isoform X2 n=1 Tax=Electrophorus electricus TaxID=8005 RepID=UPI0015D081B1|nr:rho guanine nucleotide exchange factor 7 isoform X2 [Electrophorus electricus]